MNAPAASSTTPTPTPPDILEKLQNMDISDLNPDSVITVQSLVIRHLKSMIKQKLPQVVLEKLKKIDGYVKSCNTEPLEETVPKPQQIPGKILPHTFAPSLAVVDTGCSNSI